MVVVVAVVVCCDDNWCGGRGGVLVAVCSCRHGPDRYRRCRGMSSFALHRRWRCPRRRCCRYLCFVPPKSLPIVFTTERVLCSWHVSERVNLCLRKQLHFPVASAGFSACGDGCICQLFLLVSP